MRSAPEPSALELFENAFELFRARPLVTLAPHWIGTAPFVAALLLFVFEMAGGVFATENLLPWSFLLTLLYLWMNLWQAVYCARLHAALASEQDAAWTRSRIFTVASIQTATQGMKLIAIPAALLVGLPFAWTFNLFQNITYFAAKPDADLGSAWRHARGAASAWQKQSWTLVGITGILGITVFINIAAAGFVASQLLRSLLGITTPTLNQPEALFNTTFFGLVAAATYLTVDPVVKAVYVVRCFAVQSIQTGADIRVSLQRMARSAAIVLLLMMACAPVQAVTPEELDRSIDQVLREPEYSWRLPRELKPRANDSLPERAADAVVEGFRKAGQALQRIVKWLLEFFKDADVTLPAGGAQAAGRRARLVLLALSALLAVILVAVAWRARRRAAARRVQTQSLPAVQTIDLMDENISAALLAQDEWLRLADEFLAKGETRMALRAVFLGGLARLQRDGLITLQNFKTNLDYDGELARRARAFPQVRPAFRMLVQAFERCWYGTAIPDEGIVVQMRSLLNELNADA